MLKLCVNRIGIGFSYISTNMIGACYGVGGVGVVACFSIRRIVFGEITLKQLLWYLPHYIVSKSINQSVSGVCINYDHTIIDRFLVLTMCILFNHWFKARRPLGLPCRRTRSGIRHLFPLSVDNFHVHILRIEVPCFGQFFSILISSYHSSINHCNCQTMKCWVDNNHPNHTLSISSYD